MKIKKATKSSSVFKKEDLTQIKNVKNLRIGIDNIKLSKLILIRILFNKKYNVGIIIFNAYIFKIFLHNV